MKAEFPARVKGPQTCYKLAAENAAEYPDGKDLRTVPLLPIRRFRACSAMPVAPVDAAR